VHLNKGYSYREQLNTKARGHTVLSYLEQHYTHSLKEEWQGRLRCGEILLDNKVAHGNESLHTGQILIWNRLPWHEEATPQTYEIVYQDETLLVVNKPSGLPTMPAGGFLDNTLFSLVRKDFLTAHPIHRLGRATSGLVVFALTDDAAKSLSNLWRERDVEKHYRALASGLASQDDYKINAPIGLVSHPRLGEVYAASKKGKASSSFARVLGRHDDSTLFTVQIFTGRPHQIRIHLAFIGHPLLGDPLYGVGGQPLENPGLPGDGGYFLHAERLKFLHPVSGAGLELWATLPAELRGKSELDNS
jgi:23S rRNA pseudouridine1911/1915/1917 synthase